MEEEHRDRPGWRSLELVSVPAAWGLPRGLHLGNLSSPLIPLRVKQHVRGTGGRDSGELKGRAMGVFATYSITNPGDVPADLQV